ncbi:DUF6314 family protein [Aestuariicoccus sp. MJ-SS9]|uniref:DUF6314 family protein n=1 Tax=Aestuariicoccus sp. MJ-SS9 TaxID=3079855 RepID=UPI0029062100|nr:DUF6314 family protein [Aestuariicoccus sp. MJ-SS9]MDU8913621.1 DUF6314 family protein [Aestuariicoccus sp. MJ-SS9]
MPSFAEFAGAWTLSRRIEDHRAGATARFEGTARLDPVEAGLAYSEEGQLQMPGQPPIRAERRYLWVKNGAQVSVFFDDGRPFHSFIPGDDTPGAAHWCDPDQYDVAYDFSAWPHWTARWRVHGPRKDYTLTSHYAPAP